jgi:hypothetical protein
VSRGKIPFFNAVIDVLNANSDFWPLTLRQIHYNLLNDPPPLHASRPHIRYANDQSSYVALSKLLMSARVHGDIRPHCIHDPTRPVESWSQLDKSIAPFIRWEVDNFLKGYQRDLMQSQPNHIEIVAEKMTVQSIVRSVALDFGIPFTIGRGYASYPPHHAIRQRFQKSGKDKLVLICLSDFDPEGEDIAETFARSLRDEFDIEDIKPVKAALTARQVQETPSTPRWPRSRKRPFTSKACARWSSAICKASAASTATRATAPDGKW